MALPASSSPSSIIHRLGTLLCATGCALTLGSNVGCGDDDDAAIAADGAVDAGAHAGRDGGSAGTTGGSGASSGSAGRSGTGGSGAGSGADEDSGTPGSDGGGMDPDADGGAAGAAASGGSGGTGGTAAGPAPDCNGLMECCAKLAAPDRASCNLVATNADDAMCTQFQPLFCNPPAPSKDACPMLTDCCETLPRGALRVACATTATGGVALECEQGLMLYCPAGGDPKACEKLSKCCDSLRPPQRPACNAVVDQAVAANCEVIEAALCP